MSRAFDPLLVASTGVQLIEASAGTGKTYSITSLYLRLLLERRLTVEQILVVTFTEAATAELHERIRTRLRAAAQVFEDQHGGDDPFLCQLIERSADPEADHRLLARAVSDIDKAAVSTIHGFAHRILQQHALETGLLFDLELTGATGALVREITEDYWSGFFYDCDHRVASLIRHGVSSAQLRALTQEAVRHGDFAIAGEIPAEGEILDLLPEYCRCYAEARACWQEQREALGQYFALAEGLTASFKTLLAKGLLDRLADFFAQAEPKAFALPSQAELLAAENIFQPEGKVFTATALKKGLVQGNPFFAPWGRLVAQAEAMAASSQTRFLAGAARYIRAELPKRLLAGQQQSFDELLTGLDRALQSGQGTGAQLAQRIRAKFPVALIDEFQDTDPVQYRIFRTIYGGSGKEALFLIGDPKQAIYAFRGADIHAYLDAAGQAASEKYTMATNWRADRKMVAALNCLYGTSAQPFGDARIGYAQVAARPGAEDLWHSPSLGSEPLQFLTLPEGLCPTRGGRLVKNQLVPLIPDLVAGDIVGLLTGEAKLGTRSVRAGDIAVLVRTNTQAAEIQAALRGRGINAVLQSKASVWGSPEAQECLRLLAAVAEPGNEQLLRKALATTMLGFTAINLDRLNQAEAELHALMVRFSSWQGIWQKNGVMRMLMCAWQQQGVTGRLLLLEDGERRLTNLRHLAELLQEAESRNHLSPAMLVDWFSRTLTASETGEEAELRLESDEDAVQLVTIHRSKGLEYPVVYCPYLFMGGGGAGRQPFVSLHDPEADWQGRIVLFPDEQARALAAAERFAEELRLAYVAMTRARHCCHILWAPVSGYDASALAWLLHGDQASSPEALPQHLKGCTAQELLARLQDRAKAGEGWQVRQLQMVPGSADEAGKPVVSEFLTCRTPICKLAQVWRIGSFSHLTAQSGQDPGEREMEAVGDDPVEAATPAETPTRSDSAIPLAKFPKGPVAGNFFHTLFEVASFPQENPAQLREQVRDQLRFYGYQDLWLAPVCRAFAEVFRTPLWAAEPFCLGDIGNAQRLNEMPFTFPVGAGLGEDASLSAAFLAQPFSDHPQGIPAGYAEALRALRFIPLRGFLKGFIDLVCVFEGKWYLMDYKSNHLGASRDDYARAKLPAVMAHHHYFLQYHIYTVALHRYLTCRLPGYEYDRDFGGVFYLFFKGMHPDSGSDFGVFADLPPLARIEQLSGIFERLAGEGA